MIEGLPAWAVAIGTIIGLLIPALVSAFAKEKERKDDEARKIETAPDDHSGKRDYVFNKLRDQTKPPAES